MQNLKPTIDNIKRLYGDDKKKVQRETSALYKKAQISPLAGEPLTLSYSLTVRYLLTGSYTPEFLTTQVCNPLPLTLLLTVS